MLAGVFGKGVREMYTRVESKPTINLRIPSFNFISSLLANRFCSIKPFVISALLALIIEMLYLPFLSTEQLWNSTGLQGFCKTLAAAIIREAKHDCMAIYRDIREEADYRISSGQSMQ